MRHMKGSSMPLASAASRISWSGPHLGLRRQRETRGRGVRCIMSHVHEMACAHARARASAIGAAWPRVVTACQAWGACACMHACMWHLDVLHMQWHAASRARRVARSLKGLLLAVGIPHGDLVLGAHASTGHSSSSAACSGGSGPGDPGAHGEGHGAVCDALLQEIATGAVDCTRGRVGCCSRRYEIFSTQQRMEMRNEPRAGEINGMAALGLSTRSHAVVLQRDTMIVVHDKDQCWYV